MTGWQGECVPKVRAGQAPGVYCFHQHGGNRLLGKSELVGLAGDPDQAYASELAARGFFWGRPKRVEPNLREGARPLEGGRGLLSFCAPPYGG